MKRLLKVIPVLVALTTASLWSTSVRVVNLPEMMGASTRVFRGKCLSAKTLQDSPIGLPVVEFTFLVTDGIKGVKTGETLVFRQVQTRQGRLRGIPGVPTYGKGEELILFLAGDSQYGLTSPIGLEQGAFTLKKTPHGLMAVNSTRNRNLAFGLDKSKASGMGLSQADLGLLQKGDEIPVKSFLSVVRKIDHAQANNGRMR